MLLAKLLPSNLLPLAHPPRLDAPPAHRIKEWTAAGALTRALATAPTSDPPKKLKQLARGGIPQLLRPALW